jgi:hypothetical protein
MKKSVLYEKVVSNREKHKKEYEEAVEDYKAAVLRISQANLKLAKTADLNKFKEIRSIPPSPMNYLSSYEKSISMLEHTVEEEIEIDDGLYSQLVLDQWAWKDNFTLSNSSYKLS